MLNFKESSVHQNRLMNSPIDMTRFYLILIKNNMKIMRYTIKKRIKLYKHYVLLFI